MMNIVKSDVDGGPFQTKLPDTIRDLKNEMQANAALPAAARGKDGKNGDRTASHQQPFSFLQKHTKGS